MTIRKKPEKKPAQEDAEILEFKPLSAHKALEGGPTITNWLIELDEGTVYIAKEKNKPNYIMDQCRVLDKIDEYVRLHIMIGEQSTIRWVVSGRYCNFYDLGTVLGKVTNDFDLD